MKSKILLVSFFISLISLFFASNVFASNLSNCTQRTFIVSWYYSPLPWQSIYYRSDYQSEIRLNWRGTHWASWRAVFNWMIAAPRNYSFWTKIYFPWHWVWEVHDRWQAIVNAGVRWYSHDRIDIWMWHWEEWLMRAISFWKKRLTWYVCNDSRSVWFDFTSFLIHEKFMDVALWWVYLIPWRTDEFVRTLQSYLYALWYISKEHQTWFYWPITRDAVCRFQTNLWLSNPTQDVCWYFWPATRTAMKNISITRWLFSNNYYKQYVTSKSELVVLNKNNDDTVSLYNIDNSDEISDWILDTDSFEDVIEEIENLVNSNDYNFWFTFERWIWRWENSWEVWKLQEWLSLLWYYNNNINYIYDEYTVNAVLSFQLDNWIVTLESNPIVKWFFWPSTRQLLNKLLSS